MKKSFVLLSLVLAVLFVLTGIPVSAGYTGTAAAPGIYLDFETVDDYNTADGGIYGDLHYYNYVSGEGVGANGTYGCLKLAPAGVSNEASLTNGFVAAQQLKTSGVDYRLTFKAKMLEGATDATIYPLLRPKTASGTVTTAGNYSSENYDTETGAYTGKTPWYSMANSTVTADGAWHEYSYTFDFDSSMFTLGSSSKVTVDSYTGGLGITFRMAADDGVTGETNANTEVYIDDVVIEPVGIESYPKAYTAPYVGDEILPASRTITTRYSTSVALGQSEATALVTAGSDVVIDTNGRGTVKTAGQNGDMAFMAVAASGGRYVRFQGQADTSYEFINKLGNYEIYQVTVRVKAPEFTVDETITDSTYHISSDGTVKVASGTNGKIGGALKVSVLRSSDEGARSVYFTGVAAGSSPTLTTEWVDYVGYTYFKPTEAITWATTPYIEVNVAGDAGIFYVDELSIKPVVSENLILNGDMTVNVPCKYPNHTDYVAPLGIVPDIESNTQAYMEYESIGLYVYNANSATTYREVNTKAMLEAGKTYKLEVRERMGTGGATGTLAIDITKGDATQTITAGETVYDTFRTYSFVFTPDASVASASDLDIASINFKTTRDESATSGKSYYYEYFRLTEVPSAYVENIAVTGDLEAGEDVTVSWAKQPASSTASQVVKVSIGNDTDGYSLIGVSETSGTSATVTLPVTSMGKKLKVEVITYLEGTAVSTSSYVAEEVIGGITIYDALKGDSAYSAKVKYVGADDAFIIMATYDDYNKMIGLTTAPLTKDGTECPVSISKGDSTHAKVFVFDGTSLSTTNIRPLCDCAEIR